MEKVSRNLSEEQFCQSRFFLLQNFTHKNDLERARIARGFSGYGARICRCARVIRKKYPSYPEKLSPILETESYENCSCCSRIQKPPPHSNIFIINLFIARDFSCTVAKNKAKDLLLL